ncbi:MAG: SDR family oxidoreductase [Myxococcales bacterium]|nr:SDR family oxidoreductase [Myxococcales bacterium]
MGKVLLIGGGGYLGTILAEELLEEGRRVVVLDRFFFGKELLDPLATHPNLELCRADSRELDHSHFEDVECVVDLAAISNDPACDLDPAVTQAINYDGVMRNARLAKEVGVPRLLFSSSCSVYGQGETEGLTEESTLHPVSLYAKLKIEAEAELLDLADDRFCVSFLRNATVYGLSYRMRFDLIVNIMTLYAATKRKIYVLGGGEQWRPLVHVRDVARAFIAALKAPAEAINREAFNVGANEQNYQVKTVARIIADTIPNVTIDVVPDDPDKRSYSVNFDKIGRVLDFRVAHTIEDAIEEIYRAIERNTVDQSIRTKTLGYYKYLLEAERLLADVSLNGRVF